MPSTYTLITGETIASATTSYTFSSIAADWTDLVVRTSLRADSTNEDFYLKVNSSYSGVGSTLLYFNTSVANGRYSNSLIYGKVTPSNYTSSTFSSNEFYFSNYAASATKAGSAFQVSENNASTPVYVGIAAFLHTVASPITSLQVESASGNFVAGSSFYLYGIKNS